MNLKETIIQTLTNRPISFVGEKLFGYGVPIFMLHRLKSAKHPHIGASPEHLRNCLHYFASRNYRFISLEELVFSMNNKTPPKGKCVVFTMDDGFSDQIEVAAPIFMEYQCPVTIFLITGMLDKMLWPWDDKITYLINLTTKDKFELDINDVNYHFNLHNQHEKLRTQNALRNIIKAIPGSQTDQVLISLSHSLNCEIPESAPPEYKPMSWDTAREFENKGVQFAPHTISHKTLSKLDYSEAKNEILGSWQRVKNELSSPAPVFCYPTGRYCDFGPREINIIKEAGLLGAVSTYHGQVETTKKSKDYLFKLPRLGIRTSLNDVINDSSWVGFARNRKNPDI